MNDVVVIKLLNDEDVCGVIVEDSYNTIVVRSPASIYNIMLTDGSTVKTLQSYSKFADDQYVTFKKEHIMNILPALESVTKYYYMFTTYNFLIGTKVTDEDYTKATAYYQNLITEFYTSLLTKDNIIDKQNLNKEEKSLYDLEPISKSIN